MIFALMGWRLRRWGRYVRLAVYMTVLVEGISVIIKREVIERKFPGGWQAFVRDVPNQTLCADDELARIGFMLPNDVQSYISHLENFGLIFQQNEQAVDMVVADQQHA